MRNWLFQGHRSQYGDSQPMEKERLEGIQVLRGLAAVMVLFAHFRLVQHMPRELAAAHWPWDLASIGVDIFFVISGFVVAMMAERSRGSAGQFLANRVTRVMPLYLLTSIPLFTVGSESVNRLWNTFLLVPIWDHGFYTNPAHWFGWSIASEMWFYCVFAVVMACHRPHAATLFVGTMGCIVLAAFLYRGDWIALSFLGCPLALEFIFGVMLYLRRSSITKGSATFMIGLSAALIYYVSSDFPWLGSHGAVLANTEVGLLRAAAWGIPAMFLVAGVLGLDLRLAIRWPRILVRFGDISYSFYLMQPFGILFVRSLKLSQWWVSWSVLLAAVTVLSWLTNRFVEIPLTNLLRGNKVSIRSTAAKIS